MRLGGSYKDVPRFTCPRCFCSCIGRKSRPGKRDPYGEELDRFISSQIPGRYDAETKREIKQMIAVDILKKKLRRYELTPSRVAEYARRVFKAGVNRFREVSLEHDIGNGLRLGDTLAG